MKFIGISKRFSTKNSIQYKDIGDYWDYFSKLYDKEKLMGLGLNWNEDSFEYVIGTTTDHFDYDLSLIQKTYPDCIYKEIVLPEKNWLVYNGLTNELSKLYDVIYQDGILKYEIESFKNDGTCKVIIYR